MSQTEVTFTLPESNTELNQLKHNQRGEIALLQEKGEKESVTLLEQEILLIGGDENGYMGTVCSE